MSQSDYLSQADNYRNLSIIIFGKNNSQGQNGRTAELKRLHKLSEKGLNLCTRHPARETFN